jgi:hypothetical protein
MKPAPTTSRARRALSAAAAFALAAALAACAAATRPAEPGAPRAEEEAPYPVALEVAEGRREKALANWAALAVGESRPDAATPPTLRPVTATVAELPPPAFAQLRLPKVVIEAGRDADATPTDEELRESLRRFVASAAPLLGTEPRELSLVEIADAPGGARRARYEQKPFPHPLRNGYGEVTITFTPDLRVTGLSSTAVPDAESARRALAAVAPKLSAQDAVAALAGKTVSVADPAGAAETRTLATAEGAAARELVVYPRAAAGAAGGIELRLAWEVAAGGSGAPLLVYVDAVTGEVIGARAG